MYFKIYEIIFFQFKISCKIMILTLPVHYSFHEISLTYWRNCLYLLVTSLLAISSAHKKTDMKILLSLLKAFRFSHMLQDENKPWILEEEEEGSKCPQHYYFVPFHIWPNIFRLYFYATAGYCCQFSFHVSNFELLVKKRCMRRWMAKCVANGNCDGNKKTNYLSCVILSFLQVWITR